MATIASDLVKKKAVPGLVGPTKLLSQVQLKSPIANTNSALLPSALPIQGSNRDMSLGGFQGLPTGVSTTRDLASIQSTISRHHQKPKREPSQGDEDSGLLIESCDRLFLEEFEDLNRHNNLAKEADKKLSYS